MDGDSISVVYSMLRWRDLVIAGDLEALKGKYHRGDMDETARFVRFDAIEHEQVEILKWCLSENIGDPTQQAQYYGPVTPVDWAAHRGQWSLFDKLSDDYPGQVTEYSVECAVKSKSADRVERLVSRGAPVSRAAFEFAIDGTDAEILKILYRARPDYRSVCIKRLNSWERNLAPPTAGRQEILEFIQNT